MSETITTLPIRPNAPCVFCSAKPTTTSNVWLGSKVTIGQSVETTLKEAPCCQKCADKYSAFMKNWIIATLLSGIIFSLVLVFIDPFDAGIYADGGIAAKLVGSMFLAIFLTLPVGLLFRFVLQATYARKARIWISKYVL